MQSRREMLKNLAAVSVVGVAAGSTAKAVLSKEAQASVPVDAPSEGQPAPVSGPDDPWALLSPVVSGTTLGHGWKVGQISHIEEGTAVLDLRSASGAVGQVRVCRNDGSPVGVAHTRHLDFVVINGGDGQSQTSEPVGVAAQNLAARVEDDNTDELSKLRSHADWMRSQRARGASA